MSSVIFDKVELFYEVQGRGAPLVLIAGFGQDHTVWFPILDTLTKTNQVILLDNRGAGQTKAPEEQFTTLDMANDVANLLKHLGIDSSAIIGYSMGGMIAQHLVLNYENLVNKLVLYSTFAHMRERARKLLSMTTKFFELGALDAGLENILTQVYGDKFLSDPILVKQAFDMMKNNPHPQSMPGYLAQFDACCTHNTSSMLRDIKIPTLIIAGSRDILSMHEEVNELGTNIPKARTCVIDEVAHAAHFENTDEFMHHVTNFLG